MGESPLAHRHVGGARLRRACVLALWLALPAAQSAEDPLAAAQSLLDARKPAAAYALLKPLEETLAGDPGYDYLLGIAALDSGNALDAVFALERVVDLAPDNGPARAELARAYLALGETEDARKEFRKVKALELPEDVEQRIDQYLATIDVYENATRTRFRPYVQMGLGYDSNVNSATDQNLVAVPALGGVLFELSDRSLELDSAIWDLTAGLRFTSPLSKAHGLSLYGGIDLSHRLALSEADFTTTDAAGQLGLHLRRDRNQFRVGLEADRLKVDGGSTLASDRELGGATAQWQHGFSDTDQITVFGQYSMVRYPEQRVRNVNRYTGGLGYAHVFAHVTGKPALFASGFGGVENALRESTGAHFGRDFYGLRVGGQIAVREKGTVFSAVTWQHSDYDSRDPTFLVLREDDFVDVSAGYRHQLDPHWSVSPTVRYNQNDANVTTSNYDRFEVMLTVRNDF